MTATSISSWKSAPCTGVRYPKATNDLDAKSCSGVFIATWWLIAKGGVTTAPMFLDHFYYGYSLTPVGGLIRLAWGFICGAICGAILAWLYNFLADRVGV